MGLIGERSIVGIDEGNQLVGKDALERTEVEAARATAAAGRAARLTRGRWRCTGRRCRSRRSGLTVRRSAPPAATSDVAAVVHDDNKRLRFSFGDQVVHDQVRATLAAPAGLVLSSAVLQIQNRVANVRRLVI